MKKKQHSIFPLLWLMFFDHTSLNIVFPVLTMLFFDKQSSLFDPLTPDNIRSMWYGMSVAAPHIINILMTPLLSTLSDEYGRKKILIIGTLGAFFFALITAFSILWGMLSLLFVGLIIRGAFSRTNPIAQAVIADISTAENKIIRMGFLQTVISLGAFIGPIMGGYFANGYWFSQLNFSLPFFISALFAAISVFFTIIFFKETFVNTNPLTTITQIRFASIKKIISYRSVWSISIILLLTQLSWSLYYQYTPPILKTVLHFNAKELGIFVGLIAFWLALATTVGIRLLQTFFNLQHMLLLSLYLVLIGIIFNLLACWLPSEPHWNILIWLAAIPTAMGDAIAYSCIIALYSNAVSASEQGKIMGVGFIIVAMIWALTGMLGGVLMSFYNLLPLFIAPVGVMMAILFIHYTPLYFSASSKS